MEIAQSVNWFTLKEILTFWVVDVKIPLLCGKKWTQEMKKFSIWWDVVTDPLSDPVTHLGTNIIVTIKSSGATFLCSNIQGSIQGVSKGAGSDLSQD